MLVEQLCSNTKYIGHLCSSNDTTNQKKKRFKHQVICPMFVPLAISRPSKFDTFRFYIAREQTCFTNQSWDFSSPTKFVAMKIKEMCVILARKKTHKLSILCIITDTMFSTLNWKLNKELTFGMRVQVEQLCFNIKDNEHLCSLKSIMNQEKKNSNNKWFALYLYLYEF